VLADIIAWINGHLITTADISQKLASITR